MSTVKSMFSSRQKSALKPDVLPACCMSNKEFFETLNWMAEQNVEKSYDLASTENKREQRLRQAIKAEMLSY